MKRTVTSLTLAAAMVGPLAVPAMAQHKPLTAQSSVPVDIEALGEPKGRQITAEIEARVMNKKLRKRLKSKVSKGAIKAARQAYAQNLFKPLWTSVGAIQMRQVPELLAQHGLESEVTSADINALIDKRFSASEPSVQAQADLDLTALWLKLTSDISGGLSDDGTAINRRTDAPARSDLVVSLRKAAQGNPLGEMNGFEPSAPQYDKLQDALQRYRILETSGGWKSLRRGEIVEPGETDPRIPALRERLSSEGYLSVLSILPINRLASPEQSNTSLTIYDEITVEAVKAFQRRHSLKDDGILGPNTFDALNESAASKVDKIAESLQTWRSYDDLGEKHVWANIPSYTAIGYNNGKAEISMKTVVGKTQTKTPIFSDEAEYIVANPKWYLPIGLFKRQKLRKLREDPGYAARKNYIIFDRDTREELDPYTVDWNTPGISRKIQMVQDSGDFNALGILKIIFPNKHAIYLHGTPQKKLFDRSMRALSSGCVRLEDPKAFANWMTDNDTDIDTYKFNAVLESQERERFYFAQHVPVHITYVGVTVDENGQASFHRDIYKKLSPALMASENYEDFTASVKSAELSATSQELASSN